MKKFSTTILVMLFLLMGGIGKASADALYFSASKGSGKQLGVVYSYLIKHGYPFVLLGETGLLPINNFLVPNYSWYGAIGIGIDLSAEIVYAKASNSLSVAAPTNARIRTNMQVLSSAGFGVQDEKWRVGFVWRHMSNGTKYKNNGNDWLGIEFGWRFRTKSRFIKTKEK